jgi:hypothetical protein
MIFRDKDDDDDQGGRKGKINQARAYPTVPLTWQNSTRKHINECARSGATRTAIMQRGRKLPWHCLQGRRNWMQSEATGAPSRGGSLVGRRQAQQTPRHKQIPPESLIMASMWAGGRAVVLPSLPRIQPEKFRREELRGRNKGMNRTAGPNLVRSTTCACEIIL